MCSEKRRFIFELSFDLDEESSLWRKEGFLFFLKEVSPDSSAHVVLSVLSLYKQDCYGVVWGMFGS